jgi:hypothetical protein
MAAATRGGAAAAAAARAAAGGVLRIVTASRPPLVTVRAANGSDPAAYSGMLIDMLPQLLTRSNITRPYELIDMPKVGVRAARRAGPRRRARTAGPKRLGPGGGGRPRLGRPPARGAMQRRQLPLTATQPIHPTPAARRRRAATC